MLRKVADGLIGLSAAIGALGLIAETLIILVDVIGRAMGKPLYGSQDLVTMTMVVVVFAGMALCDRTGGHISVDLFERYYPRGLNRLIDILAALIGAAIFAAMAYAVNESAKLSTMLNLSTNLLRLPFLLPGEMGRWRHDAAAQQAVWRTQWRYALVGAVLAPIGYVMVLYALTMAPMSLVSPTREVSMLFAALIGGRLLGAGILRGTETVLDYTDLNPSLRISCLEPHDGRCHVLPDCRDDRSQACCHGLPRTLLDEYIRTLGDDTCCGALSADDLVELQQAGHCESTSPP